MMDEEQIKASLDALADDGFGRLKSSREHIQTQNGNSHASKRSVQEVGVEGFAKEAEGAEEVEEAAVAEAPQTPRMRELKLRERLFVKYILEAKSGAEAARRAGYKPGRAREIAYELRTKPHIRAAIKEGLQQMRLSPDEVVRELELIAIANHKDLLDAKGNYLSLSELPDEVARAVAKYEASDVGGSPRIQFYSKLQALQLLAKLHRSFCG